MERHPVEDTFAALGAANEHVAVRAGAPGAGDRWLRLDATDAVPDLLAELTATEPADYAGALVASVVAGAVVTAGWLPLLVLRRLPELDAEALWLHRHEDGWVDGLALGRPGMRVLADDPLVAHPDAEPVASVAELHARFADAAVEVLGPWFGALRAAQAPFGRRGMWGQLADEVCGSSLWAAHALGLDQRRAWRRANAVLDLVADRAGELRVRPKLFPVRWPGGEALAQVKGTCCLWHKSDAAGREDEPWCSSCPFRDDASRHDRLAGWLAETAPAAG